ncbi:hypothetical protein V6N12_042309 [Hibiscus sabdariffa]|uniref:Uncharacterized protein n=1 Tax=Hibiscus sabdariffa TaxID=183260 RepID=A0ABR2EED9_9ROSI
MKKKIMLLKKKKIMKLEKKIMLLKKKKIMKLEKKIMLLKKKKNYEAEEEDHDAEEEAEYHDVEEKENNVAAEEENSAADDEEEENSVDVEEEEFDADKEEENNAVVEEETNDADEEEEFVVEEFDVSDNEYDCGRDKACRQEDDIGIIVQRNMDGFGHDGVHVNDEDHGLEFDSDHSENLYSEHGSDSDGPRNAAMSDQPRRIEESM